jgi:pantothenate kinase
MIIMEIEVDRMEARLSIKDTVARDFKLRNFFIYKDGITLEQLVEFCLQAIRKYGVDKVDIIQGGGYAMIFYDHLMEKRHTAGKDFNIEKYTCSSRIV